MLSPRAATLTNSKRPSRMHLLRLADALHKQHKQRQRIEFFNKWKMFVVMRAVGTLINSAALFPSPPSMSTSTNGGGPIPLTLLIKAGKRVTIKKRVISTTRIYRSGISAHGQQQGEGAAAISPSLGQLAPAGLQAASPTSQPSSARSLADVLIPTFMKPNASSPSPSSAPSCASPAGELDGNSCASDGLADFLNGIGTCGAVSSPVAPSEMPQASLVREVQLLRAAVEAQKRALDMRDRYINELVRRHDTQLSLRDIERDHVLQQAVTKLEGAANKNGHRTHRLGAGGSVVPRTQTAVAGGSCANDGAQTPPAAPLAPQGVPIPSEIINTMSSQGSQTSPLVPPPSGLTLAAFDGNVGKVTTVPMPPPPVSPSDAPMNRASRSDVTSGGSNRKRNSVDNSTLSSALPTQPPTSSSTTDRASPRGGDGEATCRSANTASNPTLHHAASASSKFRKTSGASSSNSSSSASSSGAVAAAVAASAGMSKRVQHTSEPPVVVLAAQHAQMVSLSISSVMRPQLQAGHSHSSHATPAPSVDNMPATDFALLTSRSASNATTTTTGNVSSSVHIGGGGGSVSQPTSSRKVPALRGTSILPILSSQLQSSGVAATIAGIQPTQKASQMSSTAPSASSNIV